MAGWPGLLVVRAAKPQEAAVDLKLSFNFDRLRMTAYFKSRVLGLKWATWKCTRAERLVFAGGVT